MSTTEIAVLGAGPAGLAAAWRAAVAGHDVTVVERAAEVGGMAGSFEVAGLRVDHGSHRLHPSVDPAILSELVRLLGDDLQVRRRHGRIRLSGRWVAFPLSAADMARHLPRGFALRAARDAVAAPLRRARRSSSDTFADVVRAALGPTVAGEFYAPYAAKLWGTPADQLSGELARRRVSATSPLDVVRRLRRGASGRSFLYPRRGFGQIAEALGEAAVAAGAEVRLGSEVERVSVTPDGAITLGGARAVTAARVWSTMPLPALARLADPPPPAGVVAAAGRLRHRAMLLVYLVVERPRYTPFDAHYFPEADVAVARLSEPKNYRDSAADPPGRTVLCAEVACWQGDARWEASDADLGALVADALVRAGLPDPGHTDAVVRRLPRVYPVYRLGFEHDLAGVEAWASSQPRLLTFGRQGLFAPDNTHHALAMGWAAAAALGADGGFDDEAWRAARDGFRAHVVED